MGQVSPRARWWAARLIQSLTIAEQSRQVLDGSKFVVCCRLAADGAQRTASPATLRLAAAPPCGFDVWNRAPLPLQAAPEASPHSQPCRCAADGTHHNIHSTLTTDNSPYGAARTPIQSDCAHSVMQHPQPDAGDARPEQDPSLDDVKPLTPCSRLPPDRFSNTRHSPGVAPHYWTDHPFNRILPAWSEVRSTKLACPILLSFHHLFVQTVTSIAKGASDFLRHAHNPSQTLPCSSARPEPDVSCETVISFLECIDTSAPPLS